MNRSISNQLYHFTGYDKANKSFKPDDIAFNILASIIRTKYLRLSPNKVEVQLPSGDSIASVQVDVKMACLTETPIEFISEHISKYGKFGLGFDIEWALKNGGLNVIYADKENPNSFVHTISNLGNFFMTNGMMAHDARAVSWIAEFVAVTEKYELRHEREWRFLRAPKMEDRYSGVKFTPADLLSVICPVSYLSETRKKLGSEFPLTTLIETEEVWKENKE